MTRLAAFLISTALALPALAAGDITWKINIWGPKRASSAPFEWYAKEVAAKTNGRMKMEFAYDKGSPVETAELLKSGGADGTYVCAQYVGDKMPLSTVLDLPMFSPDNIAVL